LLLLAPITFVVYLAIRYDLIYIITSLWLFEHAFTVHYSLFPSHYSLIDPFSVHCPLLLPLIYHLTVLPLAFPIPYCVNNALDLGSARTTSSRLESPHRTSSRWPSPLPLSSHLASIPCSVLGLEAGLLSTGLLPIPSTVIAILFPPPSNPTLRARAF
jgi:hypothetical protein